MKRGFKAEANRRAVNIRAALGLRPEAPLNPFELCKHYEIDVLPLSSFGDAAAHFLNEGSGVFSAVTVARGMRRAIVHNDSHILHRQHSNIMHELAHAFSGHPPCEAFDCDGERVYKSGIEEEASYFAGCLLITNEGAWHIVSNALQHKATQIYSVSRAMLNYRLRVSGALKRGERLAKMERRAS